MHDPMLHLQPSYPSQWTLFCFVQAFHCSDVAPTAEVHLYKLQLFLDDNHGGMNQLILQDLRLALMAKVLLGITFIAETSMWSFLLFSFLFKLGL
jgi:hypothetical protein